MNEAILSVFKAFVVGGAICVVGQIFIDKTKLTSGRILVGFVITGVILGGLGIYEHVAQFGQAGASIPLTGFGYTLAKGVREAVDKDGFLGILTGGLKASAGGITAAITAGLLAGILFRAKDKS